MFLLHGTGANGKSTYLEVQRHVLGDYGATADFSSFMASKSSGGPRNDLAKLHGSRFVTATEGEDGKRMAESFVKQITGGDTVTARFLYTEYFDFKPQFKLWLGTNHKPTIRGTDEGIWRRIRFIPFTVCIPHEKRDRKLLEKLKAEGAGILRWAIEGLMEYQNGGLQEPATVNNATEGSWVAFAQSLKALYKGRAGTVASGNSVQRAARKWPIASCSPRYGREKKQRAKRDPSQLQLAGSASSHGQLFRNYSANITHVHFVSLQISPCG